MAKADFSMEYPGAKFTYEHFQTMWIPRLMIKIWHYSRSVQNLQKRLHQSAKRKMERPVYRCEYGADQSVQSSQIVV